MAQQSSNAAITRPSPAINPQPAKTTQETQDNVANMKGPKPAIPRRLLLLVPSIFIGMFIFIACVPRAGERAFGSLTTFGTATSDLKPAANPSSPPGGVDDDGVPNILAANKPPKMHHPTPLFIGFTRNWPILEQAVVSYITAGWPASDIHVVDNSGVMDSNELGLLTPQNPFFVDYPRLKRLGVNVLVTPTLLTFAQLQNFFMFTAIRREWGHYYWSHMDSAVLSHEQVTPYQSLYQNILGHWKSMDRSERWAIKFFAYDHLALVNVAAFKDVGGWDTQIPFYMGDCDMHGRLQMKNYTTTDERVGDVFDVASAVPDLSVFYPSEPGEQVNGERYRYLRGVLEEMQRNKSENGRNFWQAEQRGGRGEPFYRNPVGFERAIEMWIQTGRDVYAEKWGRQGMVCDLVEAGREVELAWEYPHDG